MNVLERLKQEGVEFASSDHTAVYTAQQLAETEHIPGKFVAKPVVVRAGDDFVLCVIPATRRLNLDAVANAYLVDEVRLATEAEMAQLFPDCEVGSEPPIGPFYGLKTLVDYDLMDDDHLVFSAGSHTRSVRITRLDFERLADPVYGKITL